MLTLGLSFSFMLYLSHFTSYLLALKSCSPAPPLGLYHMLFPTHCIFHSYIEYSPDTLYCFQADTHISACPSTNPHIVLRLASLMGMLDKRPCNLTNLNRRPASGRHNFFGTFSLNVLEKLSLPLPVALGLASFVLDGLVFGLSHVPSMLTARMHAVLAASSCPNCDLRW